MRRIASSSAAAMKLNVGTLEIMNLRPVKDGSNAAVESRGRFEATADGSVAIPRSAVL